MRATQIIAALFALSCRYPDYAPCTIHCGSSPPVCPEDETCGTDGFCHAPGEAACGSGTITCAGALCLVEGGIRSLGPSSAAGKLQLVRQDFEGLSQSCHGALCARGALAP